jgi:hypothetical protein
MVQATESGERIDRTLKTIDEEFNRNLWGWAEYQTIPYIEELIAEIAN